MANKETGIIMSGDHPKLILDGIKTMTRRTYGLEKINKNPDGWIYLEGSSMVNQGRFTFYNDKEDSVLVIKCPNGQVGDRLWVRETWKYLPDENIGNPDAPDQKLWYLADFNTKHNFCYPWKPSIFMPRWASRLTLEITEVRAERLQEISLPDVLAEGIKRPEVLQPGHLLWNFIDLWDSLNAKRGFPWSSNPWIWVISFKLVSR